MLERAMPNVRKRHGTASEHQVVGQLIDAGLDVYQTVVDDQGIDAVLRVEKRPSKRVRYFDLQIKSSRTWSGIRGHIAALGKGANTVLILFNSSTHECLWFDSEGISKHFPGTGFDWGDIFLDKARVERFKKEHRYDLEALRRRLETINLE
jgi:hypothetical protein